jgi:medium-chain acyl-[acyl-carrier-protein] hydrolase
MMTLKDSYDETKYSAVMSGTSSYLLKLPTIEPQMKLRLFCFPFGGAGASVYRDWQNALPESIEICPVQPPGREERLSEKPFTALAPLVSELGQALEPYLDRPFAFFGHSMGALISFELARHLRRLNKPIPAYLFISGRPAPQILLNNPPTFDLPDPEFIEELRQIQGTPESVLQNPELMALFLPLLRADFELCQTYQYKNELPLDCPFFVFGGLTDPDISQESLVSWRAQTTCPMQLQMFPGDHFFILNAQQKILQIISQQLNQLIMEECIS